MGEFLEIIRQGYARGVPKPPLADGPWGEAIRYWLNERKWLQADLAVATRIRANTISRAARGFHTTTRVLETIALAFQVPLDDVLVSPERKNKNEDRRRLAREITEDVLRVMEAKTGGGPLAASFATTEQAVRHVEEAADAPPAAGTSGRSKRVGRKVRRAG